MKNDIFTTARYVPGTATKIFENIQAGKEAFIKNVTLHNTHTESVTVKLYNVPTDETQGDQHKFYEVAMGTLETDIIDLRGGLAVTTNGSIYAEASIADKITIQVSGVR